MPRERPRSIADLFVGGDKLRDLFEIVGMVVTNFGGVEEMLRYLDWQLQAYALAAAMPSNLSEADVQRQLEPPRIVYFGKHQILSKILGSIDKGLTSPAVTAELGTDAASTTVEWRALKAIAKGLGNRRNALAHAAIGVTGASLVRSKGLLAPPEPADATQDRKLTTEIADFRIELGGFINTLGESLPFRDPNQAIFSEPVELSF